MSRIKIAACAAVYVVPVAKRQGAPVPGVLLRRVAASASATVAGALRASGWEVSL